MFNFTASCLQYKTRAELAALFNRLRLGLGQLPEPSLMRDEALAAMAVIEVEHARRGPAP